MLPGYIGSVGYDNRCSTPQVRTRCWSDIRKRKIGESVGADWYVSLSLCHRATLLTPARDNISGPLQSQVREPTPCFPRTCHLEPDIIQYYHEFDSPPFLMAGLPSPRHRFALSWAFLPDKSELREGLIVVGLATCIAMVLIWTGLAGGNSDHSDNAICVFYSVVATSVAIFLEIPLAAAILTRFALRTLVSSSWNNDIFFN
ncbi:arsenical-resistance protein [Rutstroemia sp. NJR-2017a BVV2]|nr:arsenical-resistance protein [Rutstroemia sp. NJR-2017a BVV2]